MWQPKCLWTLPNECPLGGRIVPGWESPLQSHSSERHTEWGDHCGDLGSGWWIFLGFGRRAGRWGPGWTGKDGSRKAGRLCVWLGAAEGMEAAMWPVSAVERAVWTVVVGLVWSRLQAWGGKAPNLPHPSRGLPSKGGTWEPHTDPLPWWWGWAQDGVALGTWEGQGC